MSFKNKLIVFVFIFFILISFSSCKKKEVTVEIPETIATEKPLSGTLKILVGNSGETEIINEIVTRFTKIHNVNISLVTSKDDLVNNILESDIYIGKLDYQTYLNLALNNNLLELTNIDVLNQTSLETLEVFKVNGKQHLMPISINLKGTIVNKDLFLKYGLSFPNNWEEMLNLQNYITDQAVFPLQMYCSPINKSILVGKLLLQSEIEVDENFYRSLDQNQEAINKTVSKISELLNITDNETLKYGYEQGLNEFASSRALMLFGDSNDINKLKFINPNLNLAFKAIDSNNLGMDLYSGIVIMENSENKESALKFLEFCLQENIADFYINSTNSFSLLNNVKNNSKEFIDVNQDFNLNNLKTFYQSNSDYDNKLAGKFNEVFERDGINFRFEEGVE